MKVALISEHASPLALAGGIDSGGQNIYVANVALQLAKLGHVVDVFTRRESATAPTIVEMAPHVRVVHVPAGPGSVIPKEAILPYMGDFAAWLKKFFLQEQHLGRPYAVMHANFFMSGWAALLVKKSLGTPLVTTFHALGKVRRLHQGASDGFPDDRFEIEAALAAQSDRVVAECPQDREDIVGLYNGEEKRISVVPCGFSETEFFPVSRAAARAALGWKTDEFTILQLGRLVPRKGIDNVIRAVAALKRRCDRKTRLCIVGGNSDSPDEKITPEIARLRNVARAEGIEDRVEFVGRRGRGVLRQFYCASDVFVTTPWYEPFGITPVEAMACARPVIGAAVGGIRTTVVDGETGYLVPPRNPEVLAGRLLDLASDPQKARAFGEAGRARALKSYTWSRVARDLALVYHQAIAAAGVPNTPRRSKRPGVTEPVVAAVAARPPASSFPASPDRQEARRQ
jgi:D-inositol-3-phosphate glycosyltransferase